MRKCLRCGDEFQSVSHADTKLYCSERCRNRAEKSRYYKLHPEKRRKCKGCRTQQSARRYARAADVIKMKVKAWKINNPEKVRTLAARYRAELADSYVRSVLGRSMQFMRQGDIPQSLVDCERERLKIQSLLKEMGYEKR